MIVFVSLLVAVVGVLVYALAANGKIVEIGRIAYGCGLLVFLAQLSPRMIDLFR